MRLVGGILSTPLRSPVRVSVRLFACLPVCSPQRVDFDCPSGSMKIAELCITLQHTYECDAAYDGDAGICQVGRLFAHSRALQQECFIFYFILLYSAAAAAL